MKVRIKRIDKNLPLPDYHTKGAAGFDIYSRISITIPPLSYAQLPNNLVVETPEGYMLLMVARSSTFKKKGLIIPNAVAVFDSDFRGDDDEMIIQVYNMTAKEVRVEAGERIAQGIFVQYSRAEWQEVKSMNNENRGGIGSTG